MGMPATNPEPRKERLTSLECVLRTRNRTRKIDGEMRRQRYTLRELASKCGVTTDTLARLLEGDTVFPRMCTIEKVMFTLGWELVEVQR